MTPPHSTQMEKFPTSSRGNKSRIFFTIDVCWVFGFVFLQCGALEVDFCFIQEWVLNPDFWWERNGVPSGAAEPQQLTCKHHRLFGRLKYGQGQRDGSQTGLVGHPQLKKNIPAKFFSWWGNPAFCEQGRKVFWCPSFPPKALSWASKLSSGKIKYQTCQKKKNEKEKKKITQNDARES